MSEALQRSRCASVDDWAFTASENMGNSEEAASSISYAMHQPHPNTKGGSPESRELSMLRIGLSDRN